MTVAKELITTSALADWTRSFADNTGFRVDNPSLEAVKQAIATHLPDKLSEYRFTDAEGILQDALGIGAIVKIGDETIAWVAVTNADVAKRIEQTYNGVAFSKIRHALGIESQWILLVNPDLLAVYSNEDLYEAHLIVLDEENRLECIVVPL
jgi:hypothetical protein